MEAVTAERFFLFKGVNKLKEENWYQYDAKEGTVQLCAEPTAISISDSNSSTNNGKENQALISPTLIIILLSMLCVGLVIPLVVVLVKQPTGRRK